MTIKHETSLYSERDDIKKKQDDGSCLEVQNQDVSSSGGQYVLREEWSWDRFIQPTTGLFDEDDPRIKNDILRLIIQYLNDEGYHASKMTIMDEANVKSFERDEKHANVDRMRKAIMDGDWAEVDRLCSRPLIKNQKSFLYAAYKQQYFEYIEHHEIQKAFSHLNKRLKPLEHLQTTPNEFRDLCYLLTAKTIQDVPAFKDWEGIIPSREKLTEMFLPMTEYDELERGSSVHVPPKRLLTLLQQAAAYQIEFARYYPSTKPRISSLLKDYESLIVPNTVKTVFQGHTANVKSAVFIGANGDRILSGSSDATCRIWNTETGKCLHILEGHEARVWDTSSTDNGELLCSASGDATIKIWNAKGPNVTCSSTLTGHSGDIYSVQFHPLRTHLVSGGYDKLLRLYDVDRGTVVKSFSGHQLSVSKVIFNPLGNLLVSGSKDNSIRFWDIVSGLCIKTISSHLGEVTSVEMDSSGTYLLSSAKDNSNRLWDIRMLRPVCKYKGHQNTSKNFVRSSFAGESLIVGGSEDGAIYIWDKDRGDIIKKLRHHHGIVYGAIWNSRQSLYLSFSDDHTLATWWCKDQKILQ